MHTSSYLHMAWFATGVRNHFQGKSVRVLDVGSRGIGDTHRTLFSFPGVQYVGLDIEPGPNVDYVPRHPYDWAELPDGSFDLIVSGQALEHTEFPWLIFEQIARKLKHGGTACLIAPSRGAEHRFPVDCYRYFPDGFRALAKWSGLHVAETDYIKGPTGFGPESDEWGDCRCILKKPQNWSIQDIGRVVREIPPRGTTPV